jgi:N-acetylglucosaminyldiphosphoundecaprenol N-acetyl-beta-D-mannosaminyltransferase
VTPDGAGIIWASRLLDMPISERVSGVDLVRELCRLSSDPGKAFKIYFLGAAPGIAELAAKNLMQMYPGCKIVGTRDGYFKPDQEESVAKEIASLHPDIVFVGFGIPKQEKFIKRYRDIIDASIYIGIGGSFDVYSGLVKRAPEWMQNAGIEWIFRLAQNPKKIAKVMTLPRFAALTLRAKFSGH